MERVDDDSLRKEKDKLMNKDGFVILEYIRSSIEIIMSLKIEDLEKDNPSKPVTKEAGVSNTGL